MCRHGVCAAMPSNMYMPVSMSNEQLSMNMNAMVNLPVPPPDPYSIEVPHHSDIRALTAEIEKER